MLPAWEYLQRTERYSALAAGASESLRDVDALVSPTVHSHLGLLAVLASALRDPAFRGAVAARRPAAEILDQAAAIEASIRRNVPAVEVRS